MITTPLITKIKTNGGTLYTFTSASKDLTKVATNSSKYKFRFSHFACLNLPYMMSGFPTLTNHTCDVKQTKRNETYNFIKNIQTELTRQKVFNVTIELTDEKDFDYIKTCSIKLISPIYESSVLFEKVNGEYLKCQIDNNKFKSGSEIKFEITINMDETYNGNVKVIKTGEISYDPDTIGSAVDKGLYLERFEDYTYRNNDYNVAMAEHFQNYILNFESVLLNSNVYNPDILYTPAERIFFNWLRKVGGIKFKPSTKGNKTFVEDVENYYSDSDSILDRTVQYLGNIDIINQVDVNGDTFGEVYLYIPSDVGATPNVYFRTLVDTQERKTNYQDDLYRWNSEIIVGRDNFNVEDKPIDDISLEAIYDGDVGANYYTGDNGYYIDFTPSSYEIGLTNIDELNKQSYLNFEFNCVLIYYDMTNTQTNETVTSLYGVLFLDNFVRDDRSYKSEDGTIDENKINRLAYIDPIPKFRSSELDNGNSFALKVDLKIDTAPTTTMYRTTVDNSDDTYYDPNNTNSFQLYQGALEQLHKCIDIFYSQQREIYELQDRIEELESIIVNLRNADEAFKQINELASRLDDSKLDIAEEIEAQVKDNSSRIENLENGGLNVAIDMGNLKFGDGFMKVEEIDENNNKIISVKNTMQNYSYGGRISLNEIPQREEDETEDNYNKRVNQFDYYVKNNMIELKLMGHTNLFLLCENENNEYDVSMDELTIVINASLNSWEKGQSIKFVSSDDFKFDMIKHFNLKFVTTTSDGNISITTFTKEELQKMSNKTEIEIICIEDGNDYDMKFIKIIR